MDDFIKQPRRRRAQAKARGLSASLAEKTKKPAESPDPLLVEAAQAPMDQVTGDAQEVVDSDMDEDSNEEKIRGFLDHLEDLPEDAEVACLRTRYSEKLEKLRSRTVAKQRDPTVQLLRAQRKVRRREKQQAAARATVASCEAALAEATSKLSDARETASTADDNLAEARLVAEGFRASLASAAPTPVVPNAAAVADAMQAVSGLRTQIATFPSAFQEGNADVAHQAISRQLEALASQVAALSTAAAAAGSSGSEEGGPALRPDGHEQCATDVPVSDPRIGIGTRRSGRRGTSPASSGHRSRSRSSRSSGSEGEESALRRAANLPGQRSIRNFAKPRDPARG